MSRVQAIVIVALLAIGSWFRVMDLASVPGISGDEGWWGVQALSWRAGQPYEAHTTSGNPTDLFFLVPLGIVHGLAAPSFALLRAIPVAANLLALPIGFLLARRLFGSTTAWVYTAGIAVLPTAIAHSRICQDPSQTILWTSIVILLSLLGAKERGRAWLYLVCLLIVFPIALWTHPTNIFIGPFLLLPFAAALQRLLPASRKGQMVVVAIAAGAVAGVLLLAWFVLTKFAGTSQLLDRPWVVIAGARLVNGREWFELAANAGRLFNGVTVYHYFSGARPSTLPYDVAFVAVVLTVLGGFLLPRIATRLDYALLFACASTWLAFYLIAGPQALRPHAERWGLCLIVPSMLVISRGVTAWTVWSPRRRGIALAISGIVAAGLLTSFYVNYFHAFATTGGRGHLTYVTAPIEPKRQVFEHILKTTAGGPAVVDTSQWWLYWPVRYLASRHPEIAVSMRQPSHPAPDFSALPARGTLFFIEFADTPELAGRHEWLRARGLRPERVTITDAGGRELIQILEIAASR